MPSVCQNLCTHTTTWHSPHHHHDGDDDDDGDGDDDDDDGDSDGDEGLRWSSGLYKEPPTEQPSKLDVPSISLRYMQPGVHPDILTRRTWAQS